MEARLLLADRSGGMHNYCARRESSRIIGGRYLV